jgi:divalent metal cation (Fe/Co/Zn/Cd) transporter
MLITIAWMCVEVAVSAVSAVRAHSIALFAFGGDSAVDLFSVCVVLLGFNGTELSEHRASRIAAGLLAGLAAFIVAGSIASFLYPGLRPEASYFGIALLVAAALVMPRLAKQKRSLAFQTGSSALKADATQSAVCAYMAWISHFLGGPGCRTCVDSARDLRSAQNVVRRRLWLPLSIAVHLGPCVSCLSILPVLSNCHV